jgi:hypothetical protein
MLISAFNIVRGAFASLVGENSSPTLPRALLERKGHPVDKKYSRRPALRYFFPQIKGGVAVLPDGTKYLVKESGWWRVGAAVEGGKQ